MDQSQPFRIQVDALGALADWKAYFADQVTTQARELAKSSNPVGLITLAHYHQAAQLAVQALAAQIRDTNSSHGNQEAA